MPESKFLFAVSENGEEKEILKNRITRLQVNTIFKKLTADQKKQFWEMMAKEILQGYNEELAIKYALKKMEIEEIEDYLKSMNWFA